MLKDVEFKKCFSFAGQSLLLSAQLSTRESHAGQFANLARGGEFKVGDLRDFSHQNRLVVSRVTSGRTTGPSDS